MADSTVADSKNAAKTASADAASALDFAFNENITIRAGERLAHLDKKTVKAYAAFGNARIAGPVFAYVCEDDLTPRISAATNYLSIINPSLLRLVAHGPMPWPPERKRKYVFVYEQKLGQSIMPDDLRGGLDWKSEKVMDLVVRPVVSVLRDLRDKDMVHGEVHPANMFDGGQKNPERVVLGECLALPASYRMPVLYQTIERGMTDAAARGPGTMADDLYALGASLAVILRSHDPMQDLSEAQIIQEKMEHGSYSAITGKDRFTGAILELLRGLLIDDASQRWNLEDIQSWLEGRRLTPKQAARKLKANRPISFNGGKYLRPEPLARDLYLNPSEAIAMIDGGEMAQWLQRAVDDAPLSDRIDKAVMLASENGRGPGYPERLVARLSIALDTHAPMRFKGVSVMPEGFGKALTQAYVKRTDIQIFQEMIEHYFALQWIDMTEVFGVDSTSLVSRFDACRMFLRQKNLGFGIERCIYFLNPETHCLSDKIGFYHARESEDVLMAYEALSASPARPALLLDRHVIAFLSAKDRKNIDSQIPDLSAPQMYRRVMGELKTLATIQRRSRLGPFPGVGKWIASNLGPVYERIHDREERKKMKVLMGQLADAGDLVKMSDRLEDPVRIETDNRDFRRNMRYFYDLSNEYRLLEANLAKGDVYGREMGRQISAFTSLVIAGIVMMVSAYMAFFKGGTLF
jgi:hypothetical protein